MLLIVSTYMNHKKFFHKKCGSKVNSTANIICLILGILFEKFYKQSMASLYAAFCFSIFFLIFFILLRPSTDLGFFGFILGMIGSIGYNLFEFKAGLWIVIAICFLLFWVKGWLDKNWIEEYREGDSAFLYRVVGNELVEPPKTTSFEDDRLQLFTSDPIFANDSYSVDIRIFVTTSVVYSLKCWLTRIEEDRLKLSNDVEDVVPLVMMSAEENQLLHVAKDLLNLTNPEENQRVHEVDTDDREAVVATICFLIFYFRRWLEKKKRLNSNNEHDDLFNTALPRIATTNRDEDQLEFLRVTNNLSLQRALHSAEHMTLAMQGQALVNGTLICRIGAFRINGEIITWKFITVFSSISILIFISFLFSFIGFLPSFKLNLFNGRYLRKRGGRN